MIVALRVAPPPCAPTTVTELLALDTSISSSGVALFRDGTLVACARIKITAPPADTGARGFKMARQIEEWVDEAMYPSIIPDVLVVEWQQVYRASRAKGDPNDLLGMGFVSGAVAGLLQPSAVVAYRPAEWMKLRKSPRHREAFTSPRGLRIMSRLTDEEKSLVPRFHDAVDSAGLGLHHLGRLAPRRVFPGATP